MLKFNYNTMRYERVGDKRPDLLAEKIDIDMAYNDDYDDFDDYDTDEDY